MLKQSGGNGCAGCIEGQEHVETEWWGWMCRVHMWRVYKHTGKDQDYVVYKEALKAATNEVSKSKRNFELKLAQNIKSDSKSFYAYLRSKQNVQDKVGPLEDNAGDIIT